MKERINLIIKSGANVILTTKGIDDVANKYLVEAKVLGLRRVDKHDMRKIAKASGGNNIKILSIKIATIMTTLATGEGDESFESSYLGECE